MKVKDFSDDLIIFKETINNKNYSLLLNLIKNY